MKEKWKDIPGFHGYQVSSLGRVRCFNKSPHLRLGEKFYYISPSINKRGRSKSIKLTLGTSGKNQKAFIFHRLLWELFVGPIPEGHQIDHKNLNTLDNRLDNLRIATSSQNSCNRPIRANKKHSVYKGVSKHSNKNSLHPYTARITLNKKTIALGVFETELEAAKAYNNAARQIHGEFAFLNPIEEA